MTEHLRHECISLILLVRNEAGVIERVIRDFYGKTVLKLPGSEFIVMEDGSTDGTRDILTRLSAEIPLRLETQVEQKGYTRALMDGFALAQNNLILFSDSDGQHEPDDFWPMYELIRDCDMVVGCKINRKDRGRRLFMSKIMNAMVNLAFSIPLADINCGYRLIRKKVVDTILEDGLFFKDCAFTEFTIKAWMKGYRIVESPIRHYERDFGNSRGLPSGKVPLAIARMICNLARLKLFGQKTKPPAIR